MSRISAASKMRTYLAKVRSSTLAMPFPLADLSIHLKITEKACLRPPTTVTFLLPSQPLRLTWAWFEGGNESLRRPEKWRARFLGNDSQMISETPLQYME